MHLPLYQIDAFASAVFKGNPAAVVPLESWPADGLMQAIAAENNLAETAFFAAEGDGYRLRWFTPATEVDLCGHATLASGWLVLNRLAPARAEVTFHTRSGPLTVRRAGARLAMDFPARPPEPVTPWPGLVAALGRPPREILAARDYLVVYDSAAEVERLAPDLAALAQADRFAVCVTAPGGEGYDFVSRFFAPAQGVPEDPVTGSAHCTLVPYWSRRLGRRELRAFQASRRGGEVLCVDRGERVELGGDCAFYLEGTIHV
jgi:predicted PhzF superfamily epimerase YddE/YHI9